VWSWTLGRLRSDGWANALGHGYGFGYGMRCPACGEPMFKPSKEEIIEVLEHRKKRLEGVLDHINKEIERLKENKPEE